MDFNARVEDPEKERHRKANRFVTIMAVIFVLFILVTLISMGFFQ